MNQWLVRTAQNIIAGPYSKDQICQLIKDGHLGLQDEVCQANNYWIFLHERDEVVRQLGIEVPKSESDDEEETQTETQTLDPTASLGHPGKHAPATAAKNPAPAQEMPENPFAVPGDANSQTEHTAMVSSDTLKKLKAPAAVQKKPAASPAGGGGGATLPASVMAARNSGTNPNSNPFPEPRSPSAPAGGSVVMAPLGGLPPSSSMPPAPGTAPADSPATVLGAMERSQFWRGFAWLLVAAVALVIFAVLRLMRSQ